VTDAVREMGLRLSVPFNIAPTLISTLEGRSPDRLHMIKVLYL
jgi:hypothetical protein